MSDFVLYCRYGQKKDEEDVDLLGKTHMAVGIAAVLTVTQPQTIPELVLAAGTGTVGALISDIDVGTSVSHREADKIVFLTAIAAGAVFALDYFCGMGIFDRMMRDGNRAQMVIGIGAFIGICAFGKERPHRSFMHSFLALAALCFVLGMVWQPMVPYFAIGFLSHIVIDLFNRRKIRLFYPLKGGIAFGLFRSNGIVNKILFWVGSVAAFSETVAVLIRSAGTIFGK